MHNSTDKNTHKDNDDEISTQSNNNKDSELKKLKPINSTCLSAELTIPDSVGCHPPIFSYTNEQAKRRFKYDYRTFSCGSSDDSIIKIKDNKIKINCADGETAQLALGGSAQEEVMGNVKFVPK